MRVDEIIKFETSKCFSMLNKEIETKIIDGVYTVSQKAELDFNEEEIKKMLLMFKPMQKELKVYKKALELACKKIIDCTGNCPLDNVEYEFEWCTGCRDGYLKCWSEFYLQKVRGENDKTSSME